VRRDESGGIRVEPCPWALLHPRLQAWRDTLVDPRAAPWLEEALAARYGSIHLSHGFAEEGVAFQRAGPRDTPEERPVWYLDDSMLRERDPAARMLKLVADRRQRLDRVIGAEWGGRVRIAPYHFDPARGLYFEHGHAAVPSCNGSWLGPTISRLGGWLKRCGVTRIEHLVEERIGRHVPTCQFNTVRAGNLRHQSFAEVWNGVDARRQRQWADACPGCWAECEVVPNALYSGHLLRGHRGRARYG